MISLLFTALALPLVFVPLVWFLSSRFKMQVGWIAMIPLALSTLLVVFSAWSGHVEEGFRWEPIGYFGFRADGLSTPIVFAVALLCGVISVYSMPYMTHRLEGKSKDSGLYFSLYLLYSA